MAVLFDCSIDNIALHLKNIFKTKELDENSVVKDFPVTASDGKNYKFTNRHVCWPTETRFVIGHIANVLKEGELEQIRTCRNF